MAESSAEWDTVSSTEKAKAMVAVTQVAATVTTTVVCCGGPEVKSRFAVAEEDPPEEAVGIRSHLPTPFLVAMTSGPRAEASVRLSCQSVFSAMAQQEAPSWESSTWDETLAWLSAV